MKKRICIALMFCVLLSVFSCFSSSAHSVNQSAQLDTYYDGYGFLCVGGESIGWGIDETVHLGGYNVVYRFGSLSSTYKTMFEQAIAHWENATAAEFTEGTLFTASGTVKADTGISQIAIFDPIEVDDTTGHITEWEIRINTNMNPDVVDLMHEIGHIFGIVDLFSYSNRDKLMYAFDEDATATGLTQNDIKGFNVITGIHNSHTWKYTNANRVCVVCDGVKTQSRNYKWTQYTNATHKGTCSSTGEVVYEAHTYYTNTSTGVCSRCGYRGNSIEINSSHDNPLLN